MVPVAVSAASYFVKTQNDLLLLRVIRASGLIQPCMRMLPAFRGKEGKRDDNETEQ